MSQLTTAEAAKMSGIAEGDVERMAHSRSRPGLYKNGPTCSISRVRGPEIHPYAHSRNILPNEASGRRTEMGISVQPERSALFSAHPLEAVPENIVKAQAERAAHIEELKKGKPVIRRVIIPLDQAVPKFMSWYRSEHQNRKCKWAVDPRRREHQPDPAWRTQSGCRRHP